MTDAIFDETGRIVIARTDLYALVRTAVEECARCGTCEIGAVSWHERDSTGCNWDAPIIRIGVDTAACRECVSLHVAALKAMYSIPDEAQATRAA